MKRVWFPSLEVGDGSDRQGNVDPSTASPSLLPEHGRESSERLVQRFTVGNDIQWPARHGDCIRTRTRREGARESTFPGHPGVEGGTGGQPERLERHAMDDLMSCPVGEPGGNPVPRHDDRCGEPERRPRVRSCRQVRFSTNALPEGDESGCVPYFE